MIKEKLESLKEKLKSWNKEIFWWIGLLIDNKVKDLNDIEFSMGGVEEEHKHTRKELETQLWQQIFHKESLIR